jgi:hypothetical protein
LQERKEFRE